MGSGINMRTHAGCTWYPCDLDLDLWPFDFGVNACRAIAIEYMLYQVWCE